MKKERGRTENRKEEFKKIHKGYWIISLRVNEKGRVKESVGLKIAQNILSNIIQEESISKRLFSVQMGLADEKRVQ